MKFKKIIILLLIVMVIIGMNITTKAVDTTDTYKINLATTNKTAKQGETITISLKISDINIQTGDKGIGSYQGKIEYDTNIFEGLKMLGNDNWEKPSENDGVFTSVNADGECVKEAQEIATITLKVKETAKVGKTTVKITGFKGSNALTSIPTEDASIEITVNEGSNQGNGSGTDSGSGTTGQGQTQQKPQTQPKTASTTTATKKIPHTGVPTTLIVIVGIILIIGIYSYIRYKTIF